MSTFLSSVDLVARVLGYIVLCSFTVGVLWFSAALVSEYRFDRRHKRQQQIEWDDTRSQWLFEQRTGPSNHPTDVLDIPNPRTVEYEAVRPYIKETRSNDRSKPAQDRREVRGRQRPDADLGRRRDRFARKRLPDR